MSTTMVRINEIEPNPLNPRKHFDEEELGKLADSIKQVGVLEPLLVTDKWWVNKWWVDDILQTAIQGTRYRLIAGERRWRAAQMAGLKEVPVVIQNVTQEQELEIMLIENLQREDLDPLEEAQSYTYALEKGYTQTELAEKLGVSQAQVANRIRLLKLPATIQENISCGILSPSAGRELLSSQGVAVRPEIAEKIAKEIIEDGMPVKNVAKRVATEVFYATNPLDDTNIHQQNYPVIFDTQPCNDCANKAMLKRPWSAAEEEAQPRCLDAECWNKKQKEAQQLKDEAEERELLKKFPDAFVLDEDMTNFKYVFAVSLIDYCKSKKCEHFKVSRQRGRSWTHGICLNPEMHDSCLDAINQQKEQVKEEAKKTFSEEKNVLVDKFVLLASHDEVIFMIMQVLEEDDNYNYELVCKRAGINYNAIEEENEYDKLPEMIVDKLKDIPAQFGIGYLYNILFELLLETADRDSRVWELTLGANPDGQA